MEQLTIIRRLKNEVNSAIAEKIKDFLASSTAQDVNIFVPTWFYLSGLKTFDGDVALSIKPGLNIIHAASHQGKTSFLNALFFTLTGSFDLPERRVGYLTSRITDDDDSLTLRLQVTSKNAEKLEITKRLTRRGQIDLFQLEDLTLREKHGLTYRPLDNATKIDEFLLHSGRFANKRDLVDFYSIFFFSEIPQCLLDEKYRGHNSPSFLRTFLQKISGQQQNLDLLNYVEQLIKEKNRALNETKRSVKQLADGISIATASLPPEEKSLEMIIKEKRELERQLTDLLMQKRALLKGNTSRINELIHKKMSLESRLQAVENEMTRYQQLSSRHQHDSIKCPLCEENIPKSTIQRRLASETCPLCGVGVIYVDISEIRNLEQEKDQLIQEIKRIDDILQATATFDVDEVAELDNRMLAIKSRIEQLELQKTTFEQKKSIASIQKSLEAKQAEHEALKLEIDALKKAKSVIVEEHSRNLDKTIKFLNKRFVQLQNALFDNILIKIDEQLVARPTNRTTFLDFSHAERKLLEACFRLACCDLLSTVMGKPSFVILETPEQDLDLSYKEVLSELLASYHIESLKKEQNGQSTMRIIISSGDPTFLKMLNEKATDMLIFPLHDYSRTISKKQQLLLTRYFK